MLTPENRSTHDGAGEGRFRHFLTSAGIFLLVLATGVFTAYVRTPSQVSESQDVSSVQRAHAAPDWKTQSSLAQYVQSLETSHETQPTSAGKPLADVDTMVTRLAERLRTTPQDREGWRTLGWSYFHMERYDEAASAYAKALELMPDSAELREAHQRAKAMALVRTDRKPAE